jgi:hypothetical protein
MTSRQDRSAGFPAPSARLRRPAVFSRIPKDFRQKTTDMAPATVQNRRGLRYDRFADSHRS